MRRSNTQSLSEVIRDYVKGTSIEKKLKEVDVVQSWEELLGKTIAHYTKNVTLRSKVLFVEISSSVVKNELFMMREEIRRKLNEKAGEEMVDKIIFK
jgi:predicted nucleic acid-binding Zn ribbon protein